MYKVLRISEDSLVLAKDDGRLKRVPRDAADFSITLGDKVELYEDGDLILVVPAHQEEAILAMENATSPQSTLLRGILDLFAETLAVYSKDKAGLGRLFPQFLMTLFLAWALIGVLGEQILILLLSLIVFVWREIQRFGYWLTKRRRLQSVDKQAVVAKEDPNTTVVPRTAGEILDERPVADSDVEVIPMDRRGSSERAIEQASSESVQDK